MPKRPMTNDQCKTKEKFFDLAVYIFKLTGLAGQVWLLESALLGNRHAAVIESLDRNKNKIE